MEELKAGVPKLAGLLGGGAEDAHRAAVAITTTDLVSKSAALEVELSPGRTVRLGGIAKGSGMIHPVRMGGWEKGVKEGKGEEGGRRTRFHAPCTHPPTHSPNPTPLTPQNMATMLSVVTCDAPVAPAAWRAMFQRAATASFNQITVDGDTSTNDTVLGLTSGLAGGAPIADAASPEGAALEAALTALLQGLAKSIAWDGEGATVLIECEVLGAASAAEANTVAKSVVGSSLVKSAIFGHDPNWGRIAAAAGWAPWGGGRGRLHACLPACRATCLPTPRPPPTPPHPPLQLLWGAV